MSGGLGNRDDDFVRSSARRDGPRRTRAYDSDGEEYGSSGSSSIYNRYDRRSRYGAEEPRRSRRFGSSMASMFGFGGGRSGRY